MPQFKFIATDSNKKVRMGRVTADNLEKARQKLQSAGLKVVDLGAEESIEIRSGPSARATQSLFRVEPIRQSVQLDVMGIEFFDQAASNKLAPVLAVLAVAGLCFGAYWGLSRKPTEPKSLPIQSTTALKSIITGQVKMTNAAPIAPCQIEIRFPDLPGEIGQQWSWSEVAMDGQPNRFEIHLDLKVPKLPKQCVVVCRKDGYRPSTSPTQNLAPKLELPVFLLQEQPKQDARPLPATQQPIAPKPIVPMKPRPGR